MVLVRRLETSHIAEYRAMNALFSDVFELPEDYSSARPDDDYVRAWLSDDRNIALIAVADEQVVGALAGYRLDKFEQARSEIYIYDLAVVEGARRQGVATALIDEVRRIARKTGTWSIMVQADTGPEDEAALALYRSLADSEESVRHFDIAP